MPRIYVASLSDYNNGRLHGAWIDVDGKDEIEVQDEVNAMLRQSAFPNVVYRCTECAGNKYVTGDSADPIACPDCNGRGEVPSAEEWAIHDYEGFEGISLSESEPFDTVCHHAEMLDSHGEAWAVAVEDMDVETENDFLEKYQGTATSEADWAESFLEDTGGLNEVPDNLRNYIDFEAYARDARINGDICFCHGGSGELYVFWNH